MQGRFDCEALAYGPYFFPDLAGTSEADEQAAIDAGQIQANRIQYPWQGQGQAPNQADVTSRRGR